MDHIIFKSDGSLNKKDVKQYIQQGSVGVNKFFVIYPDATSSDVCQAVFTLPNAVDPVYDHETVVGIWKENYPYEADDPENVDLSTYEGAKADGWLITLEEEETEYPGLLMVAIRVIVNSTTIAVNYPFCLIVNETGITPDTPTGVTLEQLDSYLKLLQSYALKTEIADYVTAALAEVTDDELSESSENPVQNKVVASAINGLDADIDNVREVVEGKCKTFIINYTTTISGLKQNLFDFNFEVYNSATGEFEDKKTELLNGDYDSVTVHNNIFNSQNNAIAVLNPSESDDYFIFGNLIMIGTPTFRMMKVADFNSYAKIGDIVIVTNLDVPDRWFDGTAFSPMESKFNLTGFVASEYSSTATYNVGDIVLHNNILYVCTTQISTAHAWNSSEWSAKTIAQLLQTKQDKLTTTSVSSGTLSEAIGFDALGNVVRGSAGSGGGNGNHLYIITWKFVESGQTQNNVEMSFITNNKPTGTETSTFNGFIHMLGFDEQLESTGVNRFENNKAFFIRGTYNKGGSNLYGYQVDSIYCDYDDPDDMNYEIIFKLLYRTKINATSPNVNDWWNITAECILNPDGTLTKDNTEFRFANFTMSGAIDLS